MRPDLKSNLKPNENFDMERLMNDSSLIIPKVMEFKDSG